MTLKYHEPTYYHALFNRICDLPMGETELNHKNAEEKDKFENHIKHWHDTQMFHSHGFDVMFSNDYTKLIKQDLYLTEKAEEPKEEKQKWDAEIKELEVFFENKALPEESVYLNDHTKIVDCKKFVTSHLETVKSNNGNKLHLPYLERLQKLKEILNNN